MKSHAGSATRSESATPPDWKRVARGFYRKGSGRAAPRVLKNEEDLWELYRDDCKPAEVYPTAEDAFAAELKARQS